MLVKRDTYLNELIERQNNGMVKVITGIRRCGKSFLLFKLYKEYLLNNGVTADHIIEIALDGIDADELRDPKVCFSYIKEKITDDEMYFVLLDEVQFMDRFEEVLNSLLRIENVDVYVTGSNSRFLSKDIITEFRGRGDEIHMYPLTFAEFYSAFGGEYDDAWDEYLNYGGLPALMDMNNAKHKMDYLKGSFDNVYMRDVIERNKIKNKDEINILVDILASAIGAPTNPTKISNTFTTERHGHYTHKTISAHIDVGLRNARLNFRQQEPTHLMENVVYNELLARGYSVDVGVVEVNQRNREGKNVRKQLEVDFVTNMGNGRYYIQVAYDLSTEEKQLQEFNSFRKIPDSFKKIVIVNGSSKPWRNEEGYVIMGMKYFLLNSDSLDF